MAEQDNGEPTENQEEPGVQEALGQVRSIGFVFKDAGSCEMVINQAGGLSPMQLSVVSAYVEELKRNAIQQHLQQMYAPKKPLAPALVGASMVPRPFPNGRRN